MRVAGIARLLQGHPEHCTGAELAASSKAYESIPETPGEYGAENVQVLLDFPDPFGVHLDAHISPM